MISLKKKKNFQYFHEYNYFNRRIITHQKDKRQAAASRELMRQEHGRLLQQH